MNVLNISQIDRSEPGEDFHCGEGPVRQERLAMLQMSQAHHQHELGCPFDRGKEERVA